MIPYYIRTYLLPLSIVFMTFYVFLYHSAAPTKQPPPLEVILALPAADLELPNNPYIIDQGSLANVDSSQAFSDKNMKIILLPNDNIFLVYYLKEFDSSSTLYGKLTDKNGKTIKDHFTIGHLDASLVEFDLIGPIKDKIFVLFHSQQTPAQTMGWIYDTDGIKLKDLPLNQLGQGSYPQFRQLSDKEIMIFWIDPFEMRAAIMNTDGEFIKEDFQLIKHFYNKDHSIAIAAYESGKHLLAWQWTDFKRELSATWHEPEASLHATILRDRDFEVSFEDENGEESDQFDDQVFWVSKADHIISEPKLIPLSEDRMMLIYTISNNIDKIPKSSIVATIINSYGEVINQKIVIQKEQSGTIFNLQALKTGENEIFVLWNNGSELFLQVINEEGYTLESESLLFGEAREFKAVRINDETILVSWLSYELKSSQLATLHAMVLDKDGDVLIPEFLVANDVNHDQDIPQAIAMKNENVFIAHTNAEGALDFKILSFNDVL